ncbi:Uncharacterised protein [uncultured archaeon]|nr:Uncharacterised protein [uncultured archaeon]
MIANLSISQQPAVGGGDFSFANFHSSFILNASIINNTANFGNVYNSTASMIANLTFLQNFTTQAIGTLYNSTALIFAQINNNTNTLQQKLNNTNMYLSSLAIGQTTTTGASALSVTGSVVISSNISAGREINTGTCSGNNCNVSCSAGKMLSGGGCRANNGYNLTASYPLNGTCWQCNASVSTTLKAYAICDRVNA